MSFGLAIKRILNLFLARLLYIVDRSGLCLHHFPPFWALFNVSKLIVKELDGLNLLFADAFDDKPSHSLLLLDDYVVYVSKLFFFQLINNCRKIKLETLKQIFYVTLMGLEWLSVRWNFTLD
jgi:hypothetical protein